MVPASKGSEVVFLTSAERVMPLKVKSVKLWGKDGTGDRIAKLKPEEKIINVAMLATKPF
jgi:DNA gyrase subunit A